MATVSMGNVLEACGLVHEPTQNLIICQRCRYALAPSRSQVTSHLLRKHQVPLPVRKGLTTLLRQQRTRFQEPACAPPRPDGSAADPHLQLLDGYACRRCAYRTVNLTMMRRHLSQEHLQLQRASHRRANDLYDDVYLQTWTRGSSQRNWTVVHQGRTVRSTAPDCTVDAHLASVHQRERSRLDAEAVEADYTATGLQTVENTRPWMERTRWPQIYERVRRDLLRNMADIPYATAGAVDLLLARLDGEDPIVSPAKDEGRLTCI